MKTTIVSAIIVLALVPNLNYTVPTLDTPQSNAVVSNFVKEDINQPQFPDRTDAHQHAVNLEIAREASRLQAIEAEKQAQAVQSTPVAQNTPTVAQNGSCMDWIRQAGVTDVQSAYTLIMRESGCNPNSVNRSSGACSLAQALPCSKIPGDWRDPVNAIVWMNSYVTGRYTTWANAVAHSRQYNWY